MTAYIQALSAVILEKTAIASFQKRLFVNSGVKKRMPQMHILAFEASVFVYFLCITCVKSIINLLQYFTV